MQNALSTYQTITCNHARRFKAVNWLRYDSVFHCSAAFDHAKLWAAVDQDLFDYFFKSQSSSLPPSGCHGCQEQGYFYASCPDRTPVSVNRSLPRPSQASQSLSTSTITRPSADNFVPPPPPLKPLMLKTDTPTLSHVSSTTRLVIVTTPTALFLPTDATSLAAMDPTQGLPVPNNHSSAVCIDDVLEPTNSGFSCSTSINIAKLEQELSSHPDQVFVQNLLRDLSSGLNIGYTGPWQTHTVKNLLSVRNNPQVVKDYLLKEISLRCIAGPI